MTSLKRDETRSTLSARTFLVPVAWIVALVASYWVLAEWQALPNLISNAIAAI